MFVQQTSPKTPFRPILDFVLSINLVVSNMNPFVSDYGNGVTQLIRLHLRDTEKNDSISGKRIMMYVK